MRKQDVVITRRGFYKSLALSAFGSALPAPVQAVREAVRPVRIKGVDIFPIEIPLPKGEAERGMYNQYTVVKIETDEGVVGYCFDRGWNDRILDSHIRPALVGKDLFALNDHLKAGLVSWGGVEHAIWDAIGKIAGQPVHRLLGGTKTSIKAYASVMWRGNPDQSHISYKEAVETALQIKQAGFRGIKIRGWRPNALDDAVAVGEMRAATGPEFAIMVDRVAQLSGKVWDYETALRMARALEKHGAAWLEEPFHRDDFLSPARLSREVDIPIAGAERYEGVDAFRECLVHNSYDIMQPDPTICGGLLNIMKITAMCESFRKQVIFHGTMGLRLGGWLQASAAIGAEWQELAMVTPPLLPEEQWSPGLKVLNSRTVFNIRDGMIEVPQGPGLGLDVNEEALQRYRGAKVRKFFPAYNLDEVLKLT